MKANFSQKGGKGSKNTQNIKIYNSPDLTRSPSIIANLIEVLSDLPSESLEPKNDFKPFEITQKLNHNDVKVYRELINHYAEYALMVEHAYDVLAETRPNSRHKIMTRIHSRYLKSKGEYIANSSDPDMQVMDIVRQNSDALIEDSIDHIGSVCFKSIDSDSVNLEDVLNHSEYIVFHAFIECKILEKPNDSV